MKKIAVITMSHSTNYGGVLQSVALDCVLKRQGADSTFIVHQPPRKAYNSIRDYLENRATICSSDGIKNKIRIAGGIVKTILSNRDYFNQRAKIKSFNEFQNELKSTPYFPDCESIRKAGLVYDAYITGSDQVWNSKFSRGKLDDCYMLSFVEEGKKYSYAASTGGKKADSEISLICEKIRDFEGISVREETLRKQLSQQGINAITVADPTLLISREEWTTMEKKVRLPEHYIMVYCLEHDAELDECIRQVSEKTGYPVIDVFPKVSKIKAKYKKQCLRYGPAEFLYTIDNADYVLTNSFHALAFSFIFQKKFGCVLRKGQEERMTDFLELLSLKDRIINKKNCQKVLEYIEYSSISIKPLVDKSMDYIKSIVTM